MPIWVSGCNYYKLTFYLGLIILETSSIISEHLRCGEERPPSGAISMPYSRPVQCPCQGQGASLWTLPLLLSAQLFHPPSPVSLSVPYSLPCPLQGPDAHCPDFSHCNNMYFFFDYCDTFTFSFCVLHAIESTPISMNE